MVEKRTGREINFLRTKNGGEFTSLEFEKYCKEEGIARHKTNVYTPKQNGVAERMNKNLLERVMSMLSNANLGQELWAYEIYTTIYLLNRSPSMELNCKILEEVLTGHPCDYSILKILGCEAYELTCKNQCSKLNPR